LRQGARDPDSVANREELVVTLSGMDRSGAAVAQVGEEKLLAHGGIPGERVRVRRVRALGPAGGPGAAGSRTLVELLAVLEPSLFRVSPRCRHASLCGGCGWQHVAYPEQLRLKTQALATLLARAPGFPGGPPPVRPMIGSPVGADGMPWGFRQKSAFTFAQGPEGLVMGHYARGSHELVPVEECPVHPERANRIAFALRDELQRARITAAGPELRGLARHVIVRTSRDGREAVAALVVTRDDPALERPLRALLGQRLRPEGLALNIHDRPGPFLVGRATRRIEGPGHVKEESLGATFLVSPTAFFQTNVAGAEILLRLVSEACRDAATILDLYSGSGLFALPLAMHGHRVTAVEESRKGVRDAELSRKASGVGDEQLRLISASVESALPRLAARAFDAVVLDPPREGCPPEVLRSVFGRLRPARAVLVSCDPAALARELLAATRAGYRVLHVQPVDMFPHTPHIEAVALLERERRPLRRSPPTREAASSTRKPAPATRKSAPATRPRRRRPSSR
jgi:23S rRNA (uracil1939-C5)-methyltransferase